MGNDLQRLIEIMTAADDLAWWEWNVVEGTARASQSYGRMLGDADHEVLTSYDAWAQRVHPEDVGPVDHQLTRLLAGDLASFDSELRMRLADGRWRWFLVRAYVVDWTPDGRGARVLGTMQNVHRLKTQERRLRHAQRMDVLGEVSRVFAHRMNNVLSVVRGNLDLVAPTLAVSQSPRVAELQDAMDEAAALVRSLQAFVREGPQGDGPAQVDVGAFLARMEQVFDAALRPGTTLEVRQGVGEECACAPAQMRIEVDPAALEQVTMCLLLQASEQLAPRGGTIRMGAICRHVSTTEADAHQVSPGPYVVIEVVHDGPQGSPAGLRDVRRFVSESDGFLVVASSETAAQVEMGFPLAVEPRLRRAEVPGASPPAAPCPARILVVDDESALVKATSTALSQLGYEVVRAGNPRQALAALAEGPVDVLLADIVMPYSLDGVALVRRAKAAQPALRVVFMTGDASEPQERAASALGTVLWKPFTVEQLAHEVRAALSVT